MIECIWSAQTILGEAPFWCQKEGVLYWLDIIGKNIFRFDPKSGDRDIFPQKYEFGCIIKRSKGGFIGGTNKGIVLVKDDLKTTEIIADPEAHLNNNRFNDGKCDRFGRFWAGTTDIDEIDPTGSLYCVGEQLKANQHFSKVIVANGLGWSPDNRTMYFTDSGLQTIHAFDYDIEKSSIVNRRDFVVVDPSEGIPDGLTVDAEGYIWSAHWNGSRITRYDPNGKVNRVINMPVPNVTSLAFGGQKLDQLYVTTARLGLTEDQIKAAPLSGNLFVLDTGYQGLPETDFCG
jgi:sugar lactone lactonase YvrE